MPLYKGTTEISSNKLYKATTNIENGYKGTNSFYINQVTIQFTSISGLGLTYSTPTTRTGNPGTAYTSTTFTISGTSGQRLTPSSFAMTNLPSSLSASVTSGSGSQTLTVTISGNFPTSSVAPIASVVSGINITTDYLAHYLVIARGGNGGPSGNNSVRSGGGAGGLKTSYGSTNGGGQPVGTQLTLIPNTVYDITVGGSYSGATVHNSSIKPQGGSNLVESTLGNSGSSGGIGNAISGGNAGSFGYSGSGGSTGGYPGAGGGAGGAASGMNGGNGLNIDITGTTVEYAHGGGGNSNTRGSGSGGGGAANSGDGGNGYQSGQDGVVILRVLTANVGTITGTHTTGTVGTDTYIRWTENGTYTG